MYYSIYLKHPINAKLSFNKIYFTYNKLFQIYSNICVCDSVLYTISINRNHYTSAILQLHLKPLKYLQFTNFPIYLSSCSIWGFCKDNFWNNIQSWYNTIMKSKPDYVYWFYDVLFEFQNCYGKFKCNWIIFKII